MNKYSTVNVKSVLQITEVDSGEIIGRIEQIKDEIEKLSERFQNGESDELMTREQVCKMLDINKSTLWQWTKKGIVKSHGISNRVYYKRSEIYSAIEPIN